MRRHLDANRRSVARLALALGLLFTPACGTFEVGIERPPAPQAAAGEMARADADRQGGPAASPPTETPASRHRRAIPAPSPSQTYSSSVFQVAFEYPAGWQPVREAGAPGAGDRYAGKDGFFLVGAMRSPGGGIDELVRAETEHKLSPYGSQPRIEARRVQGQEARLILPSADQLPGMKDQALLLVPYPRPVEIGGIAYRFFALYADEDHIEMLARTLRFH